MLGGFSPAALEQLSYALGGVGAPPVMVVYDFSRLAAAMEQVAAELRSAKNLLVDLVDATRNPAATAGDELYRRGVLAFEQGWHEEASADLTASIEKFPYRPAAQFMLATTLCGLNRLVDADEHYMRAVRYATASEPGFGLAAALGAARLRAGANLPPSVAEEPLAIAAATLPWSVWIPIERLSLNPTSEGAAKQLRDQLKVASLEEAAARIRAAIEERYLAPLLALAQAEGVPSTGVPVPDLAQAVAVAVRREPNRHRRYSNFFGEFVDSAVARQPLSRIVTINVLTAGNPPVTRKFTVLDGDPPGWGHRPLAEPSPSV